ncbi:hypothetical protein PSPO01_05431 [Paraphaeosphaeria sporulosa]
MEYAASAQASSPHAPIPTIPSVFLGDDRVSEAAAGAYAPLRRSDASYQQRHGTPGKRGSMLCRHGQGALLHGADCADAVLRTEDWVLWTTAPGRAERSFLPGTSRPQRTGSERAVDRTTFVAAEAKPLHIFIAHRKDGEPPAFSSIRRGSFRADEGPGCVHVAGPAWCMLRVMAHTYIHFPPQHVLFFCSCPVSPPYRGRSRLLYLRCAPLLSVYGVCACSTPPAASPESVDARDACFTNFNLPSPMQELPGTAAACMIPATSCSAFWGERCYCLPPSKLSVPTTNSPSG